METREFLLAAKLNAEALEGWIEAGWLAPRESHRGECFSEVDLARVQLIRDLGELGVNEDAIPVVLDLIDQVHGLRRALRELLLIMHERPGAAERQLSSKLIETPWQVD
jgi:chaperone modulatory protein CbpM